MAVTATHLSTGSDTTNSATMTTASISPSAGKFYEVKVWLNSTAPVPPITVTGWGLTWDLTVTDSTDGPRRAAIFRAVGTPTAGALTFTAAAGNTPSGWAWSVTEYDGLDLTGTNGAGAIVQVREGRPPAGTSISESFTSPITTGNVTSALVGTSGSNEAMTAGSGWTALGQAGYNAPTNSILSMWANPGVQTIAALWTTSQNIAFAAIEYKAATSSGPPALTALAGLSGSGTLSTTQQVAVTRSAGFGGSGTLSAVPRPAVTRAAGLSGAGTLSAGAAMAVTRAAALSGAGTLSTTQRLAVVRAATLSGSGTLAAAVFGSAGAGLAGAGTLSAGAAIAVLRAAGLSGTGALTAVSSAPARSAAASLSGSGTLVAQRLLGTLGASFTGTGFLVTNSIQLLRFGSLTVADLRVLGGERPTRVYVGDALVWQ